MRACVTDVRLAPKSGHPERLAAGFARDDCADRICFTFDCYGSVIIGIHRPRGVKQYLKRTREIGNRGQPGGLGVGSSNLPTPTKFLRHLFSVYSLHRRYLQTKFLRMASGT
jgi:hypothetical protein